MGSRFTDTDVVVAWAWMFKGLCILLHGCSPLLGHGIRFSFEKVKKLCSFLASTSQLSENSIWQLISLITHPFMSRNDTLKLHGSL